MAMRANARASTKGKYIHFLKAIYRPFLLGVLGRLPQMDGAAHSGGRRPRSLRGGNRGRAHVRLCRALKQWGFEGCAWCVVGRRTGSIATVWDG